MFHLAVLRACFKELSILNLKFVLMVFDTSFLNGNLDWYWALSSQAMTILIFPPGFFLLELAGILCQIPASLGPMSIPLGMPEKYLSLSDKSLLILPLTMFPNLLGFMFLGTGTGMALPFGFLVPPLI